MTFSIIPVMYRDADNYKSFGAYHVEGEFTSEQLERLRATLNGGDQFLPGQIGANNHLGGDSFEYDGEVDHPWHELDPAEIATSDRPEGESFGTPEEFVARFEKAAADGWDEFAYGTDDEAGWGSWNDTPYDLDLSETPPEALVTDQPRDASGRFAPK